MWKEQTFSKQDSSIEEKKAEIEMLDLLDDAFGLDEDEAERRTLISNELMTEMGWREAQLFQKSRIKWTLEGDLNSSFFHKWINARNKKAEISGIWVQGRWVESINEVKAAIFNHF